MSFKESKGNQIMGIIIAIIGLFLYFVIIPMEIVEVNDAIVSPRFVPQIISIALFILGIALFSIGWSKRNFQDQKVYSVTKKGLRLVCITFLVLIGYVLLLYFLPYIAATIPILALLIWIYGQRNWIKIVCVSIGMPLLIYFAFTNLLKLVLP